MLAWAAATCGVGMQLLVHVWMYLETYWRSDDGMAEIYTCCPLRFPSVVLLVISVSLSLSLFVSSSPYNRGSRWHGARGFSHHGESPNKVQIFDGAPGPYLGRPGGFAVRKWKGMYRYFPCSSTRRPAPAQLSAVGCPGELQTSPPSERVKFIKA